MSEPTPDAADPTTAAAEVNDKVTKGVQRAAVLVILGLLIEAATLFMPPGPSAFLAFAGLGASLTVLGIALYLLSVLRAQPQGAPLE